MMNVMRLGMDVQVLALSSQSSYTPHHHQHLLHASLKPSLHKLPCLNGVQQVEPITQDSFCNNNNSV